MKYTNYYKLLIVSTILFGYGMVESILEQITVLTAICMVMCFFFLMATLAAPDSEKYKK